MGPDGTARAAAGESRIVGIELLRFASALAVLVYHYQHFIPLSGPASASGPGTEPLFGPLRLLYLYGFYGVEVFWSISGFIFFWKYGAQIATRRIDGSRFFVLRFSRLYPLHFLTLVAVAALQAAYFARTQHWFVYQHNDPYHFLLQLFMASNWGLQAGDSFNGPIWSISVEVLVYAIFFVVIQRLSDSRWTLLGMVAAAGTVQVLHLSQHPVWSCLTFFFIGCLTAKVYLWADAAHRSRNAASALALLVAVVTPMIAGRAGLSMKAQLLLLCPAVIFLCVTWIRPEGLVARILVPLGNMTYSSYLLHVPLQLLVAIYCAYSGAHVPYQATGFFLAYLGITLAASGWSYRYVEMPAQNVLRGWLIRRTPDARRSPA